MSDTLHEAEAKFLKNLENHTQRYATDPAYRKWYDSLSTKWQKPIPIIV